MLHIKKNNRRPESPDGGHHYELCIAALALHGLFDSNSASDSSANHRVVAHADESHHLNVCRNRGRTCKLCIRVHSAHRIGHAVGCRACCHVVRVEGSARAAAGSNREVLLACIGALLLVGACNRVLETGRVGGVAGDGISAPSCHMMATPSRTSSAP